MGYCPCFGSRKEKKFKGNKDATDPKRQNIPSTIFNLPTFFPAPEVESSVTDSNHNAQIFTFRELATATKNFREDSLLGQGGFGAVYKGRLEKTGQVVAVKQLDKSGFQGEKEFLVEVLMLSLLRHPNLVSLIGYCAEGDQRLLVYEYMPFGCLADHLHDYTSGRETLDWNSRMMIAAGAAKGLEYLHHEAKPPVIYRDVKSANILLGEGFYPKLSDFGLAKFGPSGDKSHVSTRVMGTQGYCAPEYAKTGKLTAKSDIYSFGVVLLELITGRQVLDDSFGRDKRLVEWAFKMLRASDTDITILADPQLKGRFKKTMLRKALEVAFMCLKDDASARPSMSEVAEALDYLKSRQYDPNKAFINSVDDHKKCVDFGNESPKETTRMLNKNNSERERAVAEARLWGETWRDKRRQSAPTISDNFNNL